MTFSMLFSIDVSYIVTIGGALCCVISAFLPPGWVISRRVLVALLFIWVLAECWYLAGVLGLRQILRRVSPKLLGGAGDVRK